VHAWDRFGSVVPGWIDVGFGTDTSDAVQSTPAVADVDGDGLLDVVFGAEDGKLYGFGAGGAPLAGFPIDVGGEVRGAPVVWDFDEDGVLELAVASFNRQVLLWDLNAPLVADRVAWPFMRRDVRNTGRLGESFLGVGIAAGSPAPPALALSLPSPNPTALGTQLSFALGGARAVAVHLRLYDVQGRLVRAFVDEVLAPGHYQVGWDGHDSRGKKVASGVYFLRLDSPAGARFQKLTVLR
jgi:hypothetical protein